VISVTTFHERGLSFPASVFLRRLLLHYGLKFHHLTLGGVLHITMFVEGLTRELLLETIFTQRIPLLWAHAQRMWRYVRPSDPTCELTEDMAKLEVRA
jgi:hypothetical protein